MQKPWDPWVPGVLSRKQLIKLHEDKYLVGLEIQEDEDIDHSSFDLHLGGEAYYLHRGSIKPWRNGEVNKFLSTLKELELVDPVKSNDEGHFRLERNHTYILPLRERLSLDEEIIDKKILYAQATAKSTIGRVDVLARLIVDGMDHYERFDPAYYEDVEIVSATEVDMFVEVTPISFPILVKKDLAITQLRMFLGNPELCQITTGPDIARTCFSKSGETNERGTLSVNLEGLQVEGVETCGYRAKNGEDIAPIPLWKPDGISLPPGGWWSRVPPTKGICRIPTDQFHILRSRERLTVPQGVAVYARATDEEIGEMRIHYAGFVHPHFGLERPDDSVGTPLIFEVRCHNLNVVLRQGEILARLQFYRMSKGDDLSERDKEKIRNSQDDPYASQELSLSKIFSNEWNQGERDVVGGDELKVVGHEDINH